jgi:hypothetical protein
VGQRTKYLNRLGIREIGGWGFGVRIGNRKKNIKLKNVIGLLLINILA